MYERTLQKTVHRVSGSFPVLLLTGPRQVGKTTLLELCAGDHASAGRRYVTLDDLDARSLAREDPALFLQRWPPPLIIDEIQYAPQLFSAIKVIVDREKRNGMFWMTGSQKFHLMRGITESLAGRVAVLDLLGLSRAELAGRSAASLPFVPTADWVARSREAGTMPLMDLYREIWIGSFPRVHEHGPEVRDLFYRSYIQTYIQRDVRDLLRISDQTAFHRFMVSVAARTGQLLNYAALSRDAGIDNKTARAWLSVLEASGLVYLLQPYHTNLSKRLVRAPKLYFLDTGLASYLTRWPDPASLEAGNMSGAILETWVVAEVIKSYWHQGLECGIYFYRDDDQNEIDLLIESGDTIFPVEIKKTASPRKTVRTQFGVLERLGRRVGPGAVLCMVERDVPLTSTVTAIPVGYL